MNFFEGFRQDPFGQSIYLLLLFASVLLHEYGHAWAALLMGDDTNTRQGRFIWNPRHYINWLGFALFLLIGFGPLGQAPINPHKYRQRFWGEVLVSSGGVLMNLLLVLVAGLTMRWLLGSSPESLMQWHFMALTRLFELNVVLFVFNLIPIPPLDGSHLLAALAPGTFGASLKAFQANSGYLLIVVIVLLQEPLGQMLRLAVKLAYRLLVG